MSDATRPAMDESRADAEAEQAEAAVRAAWPALFGEQQASGPNAALPARNVDLAPFAVARVPGTTGETWPSRRKGLAQHFRMLEPEFGGCPRLAHLLASVIVVLRRYPRNAAALKLFQRITADHGPTLAPEMNLRWLTSVCDTFCDFGSPRDQALGLCGTMLANIVKLMETERRMFAPPRPWPPQSAFVSGGKLFDGVICYWVGHGDMIENLLGRAESVLGMEAAASPFVREVLSRLLVHDTVLQRMIEISDGREIPLADKARLHQLRRLMSDL